MEDECTVLTELGIAKINGTCRDYEDSGLFEVLQQKGYLCGQFHNVEHAVPCILLPEELSYRTIAQHQKDNERKRDERAEN